MTIAFRDSTSAAAPGDNALVITAPAGLVTDDVLVAEVICSDKTLTITPPSGWTLLETRVGTSLKASLYRKVAGTSEPGSYQWDFSGTADLSGAILAFSGVDARAPVVDSDVGFGAPSDTAVAPSLTTVAANSMLVVLVGMDVAGTGWSVPTGMTEAEDLATAAPSVAGFYEAIAAAGATGTRASVLDDTGEWLAFSVVFSPAPASDPLVTVRDDVSIVLHNDDWTVAGEVLQFDGFELEELDDGTAFLRFTMPLEDLVELGAYDDIENRPIVCYIRGSEEFSGIVIVADDEDREAGGSTPDDIVSDVKIEAWVDWYALLSRRKVMGVAGDRYTREDETPNEAIAAMGEANVDDSIKPTTYTSLGADRDNFGPYEVHVDFSGTHPDTLDAIRWDHGDSLALSILEGCRRYGLKVTSSWNKAASPPVMTASVDYPRQGTDRTDSVFFDRETGTLLKFGRSADIGKEANLAEVQGKGVRANQVHGYAINETSYDRFGLMEVGDLWASANQDDADEEAEFVVAQTGESWRKYKATIRESADLIYGSAYFTGDKVRIADTKRGVTIDGYITKTKRTMSGAGPLNVEHELGRQEPSEGSRGGRSGGGGRGAGRPGGKPKRKSGEAAGVREFHPDIGTDPIVMDEAEDELDIRKAHTSLGGAQTYPLAYTMGHSTLKRLLIGVMVTRVTGTFCPDAWAPVEYDNNGDGTPDGVRYIPLYKVPPGSGCGTTPPAAGA